MKPNCRIQYIKDVPIDGSILDIIAIDGLKGNEWFELSMAFSAEEREHEKFAPYIKLANLVENI